MVSKFPLAIGICLGILSITSIYLMSESLHKSEIFLLIAGVIYVIIELFLAWLTTAPTDPPSRNN